VQFRLVQLYLTQLESALTADNQQGRAVHGKPVHGLVALSLPPHQHLNAAQLQHPTTSSDQLAALTLCYLTVQAQYMNPLASGLIAGQLLNSPRSVTWDASSTPPTPLVPPPLAHPRGPGEDPSHMLDELHAVMLQMLDRRGQAAAAAAGQQQGSPWGSDGSSTGGTTPRSHGRGGGIPGSQLSLADVGRMAADANLGMQVCFTSWSKLCIVQLHCWDHCLVLHDTQSNTSKQPKQTY
jgi:hypothetical protein